jgi:hypothetical protein
MRRTRSGRFQAAVAVLVILLLAACKGPGGTTTTQTDGGELATSTPDGSQATTATSTDAGQSDGGPVPNATSIPVGRSFSEGGGGPLSYTFRGEWKRASEEARRWRPGAFLVTASGRDVNSDGVPSSWTMMFVDAIPTDEILFVTVDPWGKVTKKHAVKTAEMTDQLQPGDDQIPFGIMDSDAAVAKARAALAASGVSGEGATQLMLAFFRDGTGPYWTYMLERPGSPFTSARIDALTGETTVTGP